MAYLANRSVTQRNAAVVASTLTGSTITTSVMTASTLTGSTITTSAMGFSTLTGSTITTSVLGFSTLTGSSIIGTTGQIGSLGYSTLSGSSIVGTIGQISSLGIGTSSPQSALDVNGGNVRIGNTGTASIFNSVSGSDYGNLTLQSGFQGSSQAPRINIIGYTGGATVNHDNIIQLATNGSTRMTINQSGNVGIGVTEPTETLEVANGIKTAIAYNQKSSWSLDGTTDTNKWFRVASYQYMTYGEYLITWTQSGEHGSIRFTVSTHFHTGPRVTITESSQYNDLITQIRLLTDNASINNIGYIEIYTKSAFYQNVTVPLKIYLTIRSENGITTLYQSKTAGTSATGYTAYVARADVGLSKAGNALWMGYLNNPVDYSRLVLDGLSGGDIVYRTNGVSKYGVTCVSDKLCFIADDDLAKMRMVITADGNVGIGISTPNAPLQLSNTIGNRRIVLWENTNNDHQFFGFGINSAALRYQVDSTNANHIFYAATSGSASNELMRIQGDGKIGIGTSTPSAPLHIRASGTSNPAINGIYVYNTSNTAGEDAIITMRTGGTSGGNPYISWDIANELGWSMGIDNADDNKLKISASWSSLTSATKLVVNTSGNVGIGTTNPFSALTIVNGESIYIGNSTASAFRFHHNTLNQSFLDFGSGDLFIRTATGVGTEVNRLVITSGGNVGIGTTNPSAPLTVNGNIYQNIVDNTVFTIDAANLGRLGFFKQGGTFPKIVASSTSPITFSHLSSGDLTTASSSSTVNDRMIIDSSGNVGIGTTSPGYTLDVVGSIKASNTLHATYYSAPDQRSLTNYLKPVSQPAGTFTAGFYGGTATGYGDGIHFNTYVDASGGKQNLVLFAKDTIGMRIYQGNWQSSSSYSTYMDAVMANSSGNVGIGTTNPGAYKLYVQGDIYASGNITGLSDRRFKTQIEPLVGALDRLSVVNGYTYFRPDHRPEERQMGLIAQEVQEVYPEAVTYDKENDRYGVNYNAMIAPLVQAVKEMRSEYCAQINHLKEEISSLKARLSV